MINNPRWPASATHALRLVEVLACQLRGGGILATDSDSFSASTGFNSIAARAGITSPRPREPSDRCRRIAGWAPVVVPISPCPTPTRRATRWALVKRRGCDPDMLGWSRSWDDLDAEHRRGLLLAQDFFNKPRPAAHPPLAVFVSAVSRAPLPRALPPTGEGCHNYDLLITPCRREPPPLINSPWQVSRQVPLTVIDGRGLVFKPLVVPPSKGRGEFSSQSKLPDIRPPPFSSNRVYSQKSTDPFL